MSVVAPDKNPLSSICQNFSLGCGLPEGNASQVFVSEDGESENDILYRMIRVVKIGMIIFCVVG